jgi:hypothetical protein
MTVPAMGLVFIDAPTAIHQRMLALRQRLEMLRVHATLDTASVMKVYIRRQLTNCQLVGDPVRELATVAVITTASPDDAVASCVYAAGP